MSLIRELKRRNVLRVGAAYVVVAWLVIQVRITAQLIEARSDTHLWSETYDRQLDDIEFKVTLP